MIKPLTSFAWQHEIAIGYGSGKEIEQKYRNQGLVLSAKIYKLPPIDEKLYASIDGTISRMHASADQHKWLTTAALPLAMRAYFVDPLCHCMRPFLQASFGPAFLSNKMLGHRSQGSHFAFQTSLEAGLEMGHYDFNVRLTHFCNAGLFHPNQGINLVPIFSVGYQF